MHCLYCFSLGDALLSRHTGIDIEQLSLTTHIANTHSGEVIKIFHMHVISYCPVQISWFCKEKNNILCYHTSWMEYWLSHTCSHRYYLFSILYKVWRGQWQKNDIVAKILSLRECTVRNSRDFQEEFPRLRSVEWLQKIVQMKNIYILHLLVTLNYIQSCIGDLNVEDLCSIGLLLFSFCFSFLAFFFFLEFSTIQTYYQFWLAAISHLI